MNDLIKATSEITGLPEEVLSTATNLNPVRLIKSGGGYVFKVVDDGIIYEGKLGEFDVGSYNQIRGAVSGLDAHHAGQKAAMKKLVDGYDPKTAPSILVPKVGHTIKGPKGILSRNTNGIDSARNLLARDIKELRRVYPDISNNQLQKLINLNKKMYPSEFTK